LEKDEYFMTAALEAAKNAGRHDEIPVGAVLVKADAIIATAHNCPISENDPTAHAEVMALRNGGKKLGNYRLLDTTLYVTIEPCIMCMGAILHSRIKRLVFGAFDPKAGAAGSMIDLTAGKKLNHTIEIKSGVLEADCRALMQDFFKEKRT